VSFLFDIEINKRKKIETMPPAPEDDEYETDEEK